MVQSLGISIGNRNSYVAGGQGGGIEILLNEYSNRSTPSMVAFTDHCRSLGDEASNNLFMNIKNTIYDLVILLGKSYKEIPNKELYSFALEEANDGLALVVVRHLGEEKKFTITQVLAMLFTKLRGLASEATDCVVSCPQFLNETQKAALVQAALVAGLNPLQVISDMSAVVLNYAYFRTTKEDPHRFVAFINLGQSNLQCCVAWLTPKEDVVRILASESEQIGGRDFDRLLADHFVAQNNLKLNPKSYMKLIAASEKVKKLLSANANDIPVHVESLISEDQDFTTRINRATFEELIQKHLEKVEACLKRTLDNARANFDKVMSGIDDSAKAAEVARAAEAAKAVELAKKAETAKAIKAVEVAKAAEAAEAAKAAKAAADAAAAAEAATKAETNKESESKDASKDETKGDEAAPKQNGASSEEKPMDAEPEELTRATAEEAKAVQAAKSARAAEKSLASQVSKLTRLAQVKFDLQIVEMVGGSTRVPAIKQLAHNVFNIAPSTTLNTDEAVVRGCVLHCATLHPGMKVKREVKILGFESFFKPASLTCDKELRRIELELIASDRKYKSRTEARNNLEEYIYSERSKLQQGDQLMNRLAELLDWLGSDEGEDAPEEEYNKKLDELKEAGKARVVENNK